MNEVVTIDHERGTVELSAKLIRDYLAPTATDKEVFVFLQLCKAQKLNPWLREAYLIKYGTNPATIVTGKETFTKRAQKNPRCDGWDVTTEGTPPDMTATAKVYINVYRMPITVTVDYSEYVAKKADGSPNQMWTSKPKTMLKKVALVQALREAFPEDLGGLYDQSEINTIQTELPTEAIDIKAEEKEKEIFDAEKTGRDALSQTEALLAQVVEHIKGLQDLKHLENYDKVLNGASQAPNAKKHEHYNILSKFNTDQLKVVSARFALKEGEIKGKLSNKVSEVELKEMFELAESKGKTKDDIRAQCLEAFNHSNLEHLAREEHETIMDWLLGLY